MARVPIARNALAMAVAEVFTARAASLAQPQLNQGSVAAFETESAVETKSARPDGSGEAPADAGSPPSQPSTIGNPLWVIPISKLSATRDRPLFSVSRRPRTPAVAAAPALPPATAKSVALELPPFTLVGTIIGENGRIALFFEGTSKTAKGVRQGEGLSGWILRSVQFRSAVLEGGGRMVTIDLPKPAVPENSAPSLSLGPGTRNFVHDTPGEP
jgi:hypothetical protein